MPERGEPLTEREIEILQLVATGVTNRQVAYRLCISVNTVKVHLRNIFTKLGAESRTQATMIAAREGLVRVAGASGTRGEDAASQPTAQQPPLPRFKRVAILGALLVAAASTAATWPRARSQPRSRRDIPLDEPQEQAVTILAGDEESSWHERAQMPTRRAYFGLAGFEGRLYAIAGQTPGGITGAVEIYSADDDTWDPGADKPTPVTYVSAASIGPHVYVPGGCGAAGSPTRVVEVYDTLTDSWHEANSLPAPRCAYALAEGNGRLFVFGGWDGEQYVATTYVYDPQTDAWTEGTAMDIERGFAAATALEDRIYVVGGYNGERELTTCSLFEPSTGLWHRCAALTVGRGGLGLVALGGQLYAIGGGGWTSYLGFNERYNPSDDQWSAVETSVVGEWRSPGVVVVENSIHAAGGWSSDYLGLNQVFDPLPFRIFIPVSQQQ